jgi:hypothetical protein
VVLATDLVNWVKYFQAAVLPYVYVRTFMQGKRHEMFTAGFTVFKQIFNFLDASFYFNNRYQIIGSIIEVF